MKTNDTTFKTNYLHNSNRSTNNLQLAIEEENSDSISQRDTENSDIFDNFALCQKYGQSNIEKAIILLISITLISGLILYYNIKIIKSYFIKILCSSSIIDLLLLLFYCFLRIKFSSNDWFNSFPIQLYNCIDYILIMNFIIKIIAFIMSFFYQKTLGLLFLFSFKFLLELYFLMSCVKILIFCPGYKTFEEYFERAIGWIKYLLFCCENEHEPEVNDLNDYRKLIENTTNYEEISGNALQFE